MNAIAVEMIVRMRATLPHRDRTLQLIIDDAARFIPCAWTSATLRLRAPAGTSALVVFQNLSQHRKTWCRPDLRRRSERADHVLAFQNEMNGYEVELVDRMLQCGSVRTPAPGSHEDGRHIVFDERADAHRTLRTPYVLPPKRPR